MKKIIIPFLALLALAVLPGCSEKFKVAAPYKNITVIYGLLDRNDTAHYIRIQKAFLDDNKSALTMAQVSDSNFYNNINVRIERLTLATLEVFDTIHLNKVNLDNEGYPKAPGTFFTAPNYAYKFTDVLDPYYIYRIVVTNNATGDADSAEASVIDDKNISSFYIYLLDDTTATHQQMDFSSLAQNQKINVQGYYTAVPGYTYRNQPTPVAVVQSFIRFFWVDSVGVPGGAKTPNYYDFDLGYTGVTPANLTAFNYNVKNADVFNALTTGMGAAPTNIYRLMDRAELFVYLGTSDFNTYVTIQSLQGTGLTGNEVQPVYTNITGKNVLGLYTSRGLRTGMFTLSNKTIQALADSPSARIVKVVGTAY